MGTNIYTATAGGLGDTIYNYLSPVFDTSFFAAVKAADPSCQTTVYVWSENPQSADFLLHDPAIDRVEYHPVVPNWHEITLRLSAGCRTLTADEKLLTPVTPVIHLDPAEAEVASRIADGGPYVVIHPFAGTDDRTWDGRVDAAAVARMVLDLGLRPVVVGGGSRESGGFVGYDLVNRHTARLHAHLANKASRFVGAVSAYSVAAAAGGVPSLLIGPQHSKDEARRGPGPFELFRRNGTTVLTWGEDLIGHLHGFLGDHPG